MKSSQTSKENRTRIGLYLDPPQLAGLQAISKETGAPVSELIRRAIDQYLQKKGGRS